MTKIQIAVGMYSYHELNRVAEGGWRGGLIVSAHIVTSRSSLTLT